MFWRCPACTFDNPIKENECQVCLAKKPNSTPNSPLLKGNSERIPNLNLNSNSNSSLNSNGHSNSNSDPEFEFDMIDLPSSPSSSSSQVYVGSSSTSKSTILSNLKKIYHQIPKPKVEFWECKTCTFLNERKSARCQICNIGIRPENELNRKTNTKKCESCTVDCLADEILCPVCSFKFPVQTQLNENILKQTWECPQCSHINQPGDSTCEKCSLRDLAREEMLSLYLINKLKDEEIQNRTNDLQVMIEIETRNLQNQFGDENRLAHIEISKNVDLILDIQEKKAQEEWKQLFQALNGKPFKDSDFPRRQDKKSKWVRSHEINFDTEEESSNIQKQVCVIGEKGLTATDIEQGDLGNCWFLSALAVLAEKSEKLVSRLLLTREINSIGAYQVRFCFQGTWTTVLIDDYFPVAEGDKLKYSKAYGGQLWVSIIEKAYAKLHGSYGSLMGGYAFEAMADFTGAPCERISLKELDPKSNNYRLEIDTLWANMLSFRQSEFLISGSCSSKNAAKVGLLTDHSYSILDILSIDNNQLIKLSNPWRETGWNGAWSDQSPLWTNEMKDKLSFNQKPKGVFYMCYPDLLKYFSAIEVCKLRDNWHDSRISSFFSGSPSCLRTSSSMFLISVSRPTWIVFQLIQEREFNEDDTIEEQDCDYSDLGLFVSQISEKNCLMSSLDSINPHNLVLNTDNHKFIAATFPTITRIIHCETFLTEIDHPYLVMPVTFNAKGSKKFVLSCYSANPILLRELNFDQTCLTFAAQQAILKHQENVKIFEEYCLFYSGPLNDSIWFFIVNNHPTKTFQINLELSKSTNLNSSRTSLKTFDSIAPGYQQILNVLSLDFGSTSYSYSVMYSYEYLPVENQSREHIPILDTFHQPLPISG